MMAKTAAAEPISSMSARPTWAATNRPQEPPVSASPIRSRMCADREIVERVSHGALCPIILVRIMRPYGASHPECAHATSFFSLSGKFHDLAPARGLGRDHLAEPAGAGANGRSAKLRKALLDMGLVEGGV